MTQKRRILFVDDEPLIIKGIQRAANRYENEWDMYFANSGLDALALLERSNFDVLVTDMRMPGMDGLQLLEKVADRFPGVIRIVLSGNSEVTSMMRSTQLAHQFLAKPCDIDELHRILDQAYRRRNLLNDPRLIRLTTGMVKLPSMPQLYVQLVEELQSEEPNSMRVGQIIAQDVAMTAKILQLVNSAFFSLPGNITSPQRAVTILGTNTIKALVLGIQIFSEFNRYPSHLFSIDALWKHSILVGQLTRRIAQDCGLPNKILEDCQVAGLLHDIGKLLELRIPRFFQRCTFEHGFVTLDSEQRILGVTHALLGAYLLGIWGLPVHLVDAVAHHHQPAALADEGLNLTTALHVANGLHYLETIGKPGEYHLAMDTAHIRKMGVEHRLDDWGKLCRLLMVSSGAS